MSLIRDAKPMVVPATAIGTAFLILCLSITSSEAVAAELIPDSELATLYGGWFPNPECVEGDSCPNQIGCEESGDPADNCCICIPVPGYRCQDSWSWYPDWWCDDGNRDCPNANLWPQPSTGFCGPEGTCNPDWGGWGPYPDCGGSVTTCDD
jgi:hypothetical protein